MSVALLLQAALLAHIEQALYSPPSGHGTAAVAPPPPLPMTNIDGVVVVPRLLRGGAAARLSMEAVLLADARA